MKQEFEEYRKNNPREKGEFDDEDHYDEDEHDSEDEHSDEHESDDGYKSNEHERHSKDKHNRVVPTLSAPDKVSIHAGEYLKLAVTAFDCADRPIKIQANQLPKGAKIENSIEQRPVKYKAELIVSPI
jgi:hypothetical protein